MKIRARKGKATDAWQVDLGVVDGRRVQRSFKSRREAQEFLDKANGVSKARGEFGISDWMEQSQELLDLKQAHLALADEMAREIGRRDKELARLSLLLEGHARVLPPHLPARLLETAEHFFHAAVPHASGIYFLCCQNEVVYVGQSNSVLRRLGQHHDENVYVFDCAWWQPCALADLTECETMWIQRLRPKYNYRLEPGMVFGPRQRHRFARVEA